MLKNKKFSTSHITFLTHRVNAKLGGKEENAMNISNG
jgi:hypothetical protein